ncbi:addiction module antitoxin RelB [Hyphomonas sp. CACIAM 19H1]|uniref:type II toxin-antitoxin system RelE/ParE family toxin n=1 Tax=Hyphomonas sp. CACIAM 19H1 TaxID=1873716 RepID=UPI000DEDDB9E|nr:type II toxin-antitoxin system RelE/ParE family toxin [Hyphomonas sp. CACIAM 19H1]AXE65373.1 addiction module antitoxin RelB [Hyphomonas sp. CACIAM 19H1]
MKIEQTDAFEQWFSGLKDRKAKIRITARLVAIQEGGHFGDHKSVGHKVSELRFHFGPGYRVYFTLRGEELVLLLGGGDKDSQDKDIARAVRLVEETEGDN